MGRPPNTEERRSQIVNAFMTVVARQGYAGASIQEIAREAGLTPGLLHYHFESKQEMLIALFKRLESLIHERTEAELRKLEKVDPLSALDALIDAFLALDETADHLAIRSWTMISAEAISNPGLGRAFKEVVHQQLQSIEKLVRQAFPAGVRRRTIQAASSAILAAIHGSFLLASTAPGTIPAGSATSSVKRMARGLIMKGG